MTDANVFQLSQPGTFTDPLTEILRNGARALLAQAVEAEVSGLLSCHADKLTDDGRRRIFKLAEAAEKSWRRLDGQNQLPKVILGVKFADGIEVVRSQAQAAAATEIIDTAGQRTRRRTAVSLYPNRNSTRPTVRLQKFVRFGRKKAEKNRA